MKLEVEPYLKQLADWPDEGKHILAQYDSDSVVVYQAYRPAIGLFAAENGYFGGDFSYKRMSWIKTNFLWMMYRSGWGTKKGQEVILAVHLKRAGFNSLLMNAVHSTFVPEIYGSNDEWQEKVQASEVRLQWDPDHTPDSVKTARRAIQLGLRGKALQSYGTNWIVNIEDIQMKSGQKETALDTSCTAVTYKFVEAPPQAPKDDKAKKSRRARRAR